MSLQTIRDKLVFGCKGSLIDSIGTNIPVYTRASSAWLEEYVDGKLRLSPVEAYNPAFRGDQLNIY